MKKIILLLLMVAISFANHVKSQGTIALTTPEGSTTLYDQFETALKNANTGDFIYLPGGTFTQISDITKGVNIIGTGHYPDSTVYTNRTIIQGNLNIGKGANNALIEGLYITGDIVFRAEQRSDNVVIRRCNVNTITIGNYGFRDDSLRCYNPTIIHNIVRSNIAFMEAYGFNLKGNIINGQLQTCVSHGGIVENNVLLSVGDKATFADLRNITFKNNIFMNTQSLGYQAYACWGSDGTCGTFNCTFLNNIFVGKDTTLNILPMAIVNVNNKFLVDASTIFVKQTGTTFNYNNNYHLSANSPGKNAGNDGKDIGIYGSSDPYKESALPSNPHISFKDIPASTAPNGTIQVNFRVNAQDK